LFHTLLGVDTITALGSTYANAVALTAGRNLVLAADGAVGVMLPPGEVGMTVTVVNTVAASALLVYPNTGGQINALTVTTQAFSQSAGSTAVYSCDVGGAAAHWYVSANNLTGTATSASQTELNTLAGAGTGGTVVASKAQIADANQNLGAVKATSLSVGTSGSETAFTTPVPMLYISTIVTDGAAFTADRAYQVVDIKGRTTVAATTAASLTFWKVGSATAMSAGTQVSTGSFNLATTADITTTVGITATTLAAGDSLGWTLAGTPTAAVGSITFNIKPV
jgi:hypothetical protein